MNRLKAVGYIRVSTIGQAVDGVSLDAQRARIQAWALVNDSDLIHIYSDEGISGIRGNRPELLQALNYVVHNKATLIVYSLSRLSRSTRDTLEIAEKLDKAEANLVSLSEKIDTTTASGKMVFRMLAVLNEFERDQISDRTKTALSYKKSNKEKTGGICPYGYDEKDGRLIVNQREQVIIIQIHKLHSMGMNYSNIAKELNNQQCRTKTGTVWYPQTVKNIIMRCNGCEALNVSKTGEVL